METQKVAFGTINITKDEVLRHYFKSGKADIVIAQMSELTVVIEPHQWSDEAIYRDGCRWAIHVKAAEGERGSTIGLVTVTALKGIGLAFTDIMYKLSDQFNFARGFTEEHRIQHHHTNPPAVSFVPIDSLSELTVFPARAFTAEIQEKLVNTVMADDTRISIFQTKDQRFLQGVDTVIPEGQVIYVACMCRDYVLEAEGGFPVSIHYADWEHVQERYRVEYYAVGSSIAGVVAKLRFAIISANEHLYWEPEGPLGHDEKFAAVSTRTTQADIDKLLREDEE